MIKLSPSLWRSCMGCSSLVVSSIGYVICQFPSLGPCSTQQPQPSLMEIACDPFHDASKDTGFTQFNGKIEDTIEITPGQIPRRVSWRKLRNLLATRLDIEVRLRYVSSISRSPHLPMEFGRRSPPLRRD